MLREERRETRREDRREARWMAKATLGSPSDEDEDEDESEDDSDSDDDDTRYYLDEERLGQPRRFIWTCCRDLGDSEPCESGSHSASGGKSSYARLRSKGFEY
jgi:hypothetical protein